MPWSSFRRAISHGSLTRYVKLRVAHAPGMPGTFSPPPRPSDPDMHDSASVTHVPWCMPGSLTSGFLWTWWRGKRSRHSWRMRNQHFYVSGKRPIACINVGWDIQWHTALLGQSGLNERDTFLQYLQLSARVTFSGLCTSAVLKYSIVVKPPMVFNLSSRYYWKFTSDTF